mmetsp:Transcript_112734/g.204892  ORF Transcript_112734/g.204892 Transcript_112734/m.204892 type:complete len:463 (-) Transcript_112734:371-1759(-)
MGVGGSSIKFFFFADISLHIVTMARTLSLVLACFACTGHGRGVQTQSGSSFEGSDPLKRLASLILALDHPEVGWQTSGYTPKTSSKNLHSRRSAQPTMKKRSLTVSEDLVKASVREQDEKQREREREAKKAAVAAKLQQELLSGARKPETVEELYELVKKQKGEEEAMKFIVEKAAHAAKRRASYFPPGSSLPEPSDGIARLHFLDQNGGEMSYESLQAAADGKRSLVLIASSEPVLQNRLREIFSEMNSMASELDAAVIGVSAARTREVKKYSHKWGISFPLVSDADSKWLGPLNCNAQSEQLVIHIVDVATQTIVTTFDGKGHFAPPMLAKIIATAVQQTNKELATRPSPATLSTPKYAVPKVHSSESKVASSETLSLPSHAQLKAENARLKEALQEAGILEKATEMAAENEKLRAALIRSKASRAEHEAKKAQLEAKNLHTFNDMLESAENEFEDYPIR